MAKNINRMTKSELKDEIAKLTEVLEVTARRHEEIKKIVDKVQIEEKEIKWRNMFPGSFFPKKK